MTAKKTVLDKAPEKLDWSKDLSLIIETAIASNPRHINELLMNMSLLYNVSYLNLPFKTLILFTDQTFAVSQLDTKTLLNNWNDQFGFLATYFNQSLANITENYKRLPITLGKFAFQRFDDEKDTHHILCLHNIQFHYSDAQCKKATWIEVDDHFKFKMMLKNKTLIEKMRIYEALSQQHLKIFNQMAFYSHNHFTKPHTSKNHNNMVNESSYRPIKEYQGFGPLDTMYQFSNNILQYVIGPEKLDRIKGKNTQAKIRKIRKGLKKD